MAKLTTQYVDGWPMMTPLGKKEQVLLQQHVVAGERILGQVIANFGQAIVATDQKILVVKTGLMAGQTFGGKATTFDYRNVVGIEVRTGLVQGEFEILAGGLVAPQRNNNATKVNINELPNAVVFAKTDTQAFNAMGAKLRELSSSEHSGPAIPLAPMSSASIADPIEQLRRLGELRDAGVVTPEEFEAKKAQLLGQI